MLVFCDKVFANLKSNLMSYVPWKFHTPKIWRKKRNSFNKDAQKGDYQAKFNCYQVISSLTILDIIPSKGPTFQSDHLITSKFSLQDQIIDSQVFLLIDSNKRLQNLDLKFPGDNCRTLPSAWSEFSNPNYQPHAPSTITQFGLIPPVKEKWKIYIAS